MQVKLSIIALLVSFIIIIIAYWWVKNVFYYNSFLNKKASLKIIMENKQSVYALILSA